MSASVGGIEISQVRQAAELKQAVNDHPGANLYSSAGRASATHFNL